MRNDTKNAAQELNQNVKTVKPRKVIVSFGIVPWARERTSVTVKKSEEVIAAIN